MPWLVRCRTCASHLYTYAKRSPGGLIKCQPKLITKDSTISPCRCPKCDTIFCRPRIVAGRPAHYLLKHQVTTIKPRH